METINIHALRIFGLVAHYGSVTKASEALRISQPAVSKHIRNLEEELGCQLVRMHGRGIALTEAGADIAPLARKLHAIETETLRSAQRYATGQRGTVRLSATYLPANFLLPERVASFKLDNPDVRITSTTANSDQAFRLLLDHEADLAVIGGNAAEPVGVVKRLLKQDEVWFVVPASHQLAGMEVTLQEMLREPFVLREEGSSMREMLLALCRTHGLRLPVIGMQVNGLQETLRTIASGYGAGFVSALEAREAVARGEAARVYVSEAAVLFNTIGVFMREGETLLPAAARFYDSLFDGEHSD